MRFLWAVIFFFFSMSFYGQGNPSAKKQAEEGCFFTINGIIQKGVLKMKKEQFKNMVIGYYINLQNQTVSDKATSFNIKIPGIQAEEIKGGKIDDRMYQKILRTASRGDFITIFDIKRDVAKYKFNGIICDAKAPLVIEIY